MRVSYRLSSLAAFEIWMDHVSHDRTRTDDRHLDHDVVKLLRVAVAANMTSGRGFQLETFQSCRPSAAPHRLPGRPVASAPDLLLR